MIARDPCTSLADHARHWRDMEPHTATLTRLARDARTILEMGVREGVSTWALLDGLPESGRLWSIDSEPSVRHAVPVRVLEDPRWVLITGDSLEAPTPEAVDVAFIDTEHTRDRTLAEVRLCASLGARVIVLHDWCTTGVAQAVIDFLAEDRRWTVWVEPSHWGLVVLERRP